MTTTALMSPKHRLQRPAVSHTHHSQPLTSKGAWQPHPQAPSPSPPRVHDSHTPKPLPSKGAQQPHPQSPESLTSEGAQQPHPQAPHLQGYTGATPPEPRKAMDLEFFLRVLPGLLS